MYLADRVIEENIRIKKGFLIARIGSPIAIRSPRVLVLGPKITRVQVEINVDTDYFP